MPGDSEQPVTVGDLQVRIPQGDDATGWWDYRPATVADLVSALRAEGVLTEEFDHEGVTAIQGIGDSRPRYVVGRPLRRLVSKWSADEH